MKLKIRIIILKLLKTLKIIESYLIFTEKMTQNEFISADRCECVPVH
jgi:hypothetical protein